jgi:uncharacterized repeat protein (TIGR02543 family)
LLQRILTPLINGSYVAQNTAYHPFCIDYSDPANQAAFVELLGTVEKAIVKFGYFDEMPVPTKAGFTFDGWYNGDTKVEKITGDCELVAKWNLAASFEIKPVIDSLLRLELATAGDLSQYDNAYFDVNGTKVYADKDGKFIYTGLLQNIILKYEAKLIVSYEGAELETEVQTFTFDVYEGTVPPYKVTATEKLVGATAAFKSRSLVVDGNMAIKYTLEAPETAKVVFKDKATGLVYKEYNVNTLEKDEAGYYVIKLEVSAKDWGMEISATICDQANVALSNTNYCSVMFALTGTVNAGTLDAQAEKTYRALIKAYLG